MQRGRPHKARLNVTRLNVAGAITRLLYICNDDLTLASVALTLRHLPAASAAFVVKTLWR